MSAQPVKLILIDHVHSYDHLTNLLFKKMQNQIKGFVRWFSRREQILNEIRNNHDDEYFIPKPFSVWIEKEEMLKREMGFLPIEFSLNRDCLVAYLIVSNLFSLPRAMFQSFSRVRWNEQVMNVKNEGFILSSLLFDQNETELIGSLPSELVNSKEFLLKAFEMCGSIIGCDYLNRDLEDRDLVLRAVRNSEISLLEELPETYWNDEEIVFHSCSLCPADAELMSDSLKSDRDFILSLVEKDPHIFRFVTSELKNDQDFVRKCLDRAGTPLFEYIPDWILEPIAKDINLFKQVCSKQFVKDYFSIAASKFLSDQIILDLSNDRDFAYACTKNRPTAASFFSPEIRKEKEFIKLSKNLNMAPDKNALDGEFLKEMYQLDIQNFHYMPEEFKSNKSFVLELMEINGLGLEFLSTLLRTDHDIIERAIQQNGSSLYVALSKERRNKKLQEMATEINGYFEYQDADEITFRKHLKIRLEKEYFGFEIPTRFCLNQSNETKTIDFLIGDID